MAERKQGKFVFSLETSLSILAVVSSFCAIGITLYQVYLQRIEHYASALPYLMVSSSNIPDDKNPKYMLIISNKGVGLAKIEKIEVWFDKVLVENESAVINKLLTGDTLTARFFSNLWKGRVISPEEQFEWIKVSGPGAEKIEHEFDRGKIQFRILFTSIYDEKWYFNSIPGKPLVEKVEDRILKATRDITSSKHNHQASPKSLEYDRFRCNRQISLCRRPL